MAYFPQMPMPMPLVFGKTQYRYHTVDGGPPSDGKPPAPPQPAPGPCFGPPLGFSPSFGFPGGSQPPHPPPYSQGLPQNYACYPVGTAPRPPASGCIWIPSNSQSPRSVPQAPYLNSQAPPFTACDVPRVPPNTYYTQPPGEGNRVNGELIKVGKDSAYLAPEQITTFHVLEPGASFEEFNSAQELKALRCMPTGNPIKSDKLPFKIQLCDSTWTVAAFIKSIVRAYPTLLGRFPNHHFSLKDVGVEQWHESVDGKGANVFTKGTCLTIDDPRSQCTLSDMGWGPEHGKPGQRPPVWIMTYP